LEHSLGEPKLAPQVDNLAKSGKVQKLDNLSCYYGWVQVLAGRLTRGLSVSIPPRG